MKFVVLSLVLILVISSVLSEEEKKCSPGESQRIDCNNCVCTKDGTWGCTKKRCITKRELKCEPGSSFKQDCNTCRCNAEGTEAACTLKACIDLPRKNTN